VSHPQQLEFFESVRSRYPDFFEGCRVLEVGSLDINGSIRGLFSGCDYVGLDLEEGPGVDFVGEGQSVDFADSSFDAVVSAECFEHNPFWRETFLNMYRMSSGLVAFSCATEGRMEHGTSRTTPEDSPFTVGRWDYYRNLTEGDFADLEFDQLFVTHEFSVNRTSHDLYFWGIVRKPGVTSLVEAAWAERDGVLEALALAEAERDGVLEALALAEAERDGVLEALALAEADLRRIQVSRTWRYSQSLRVARSRQLAATHELVGEARAFGRRLPVSNRVKHRVKTALGLAPSEGRARWLPSGWEPMHLPEAGDRLVRDKRAVIVTVPHTLSLARRIQSELAAQGIESGIFQEVPDVEDDAIHFILACQAFRRLPKNFVAYQLEQSTSDRWFSKDYFDMLKRAIAVLDYSPENIEFLRSQGLEFSRLFYVPVAPGREDLRPGVTDAGPNSEWDVHRTREVLFYGDASSPRRKDALATLGKRFPVRVVTDVFGPEMDRMIAQARVVVNIHFYDRALLETTRIAECASLGTPVVTESSVDCSVDDASAGPVVVQEGDWDALADAIAPLMKSDEAWLAARDRLVAAYSQGPGFREYFRRFLHACNEELGRGDPPIVGELDNHHPRIVLTLPETPERRNAFLASSPLPFAQFHGMRHADSWIGCARSYRAIGQFGLDEGMTRICVVEDDLEVRGDLPQLLESINTFLDGLDDWDVFAGTIADLSAAARVLWVREVDGLTYVCIDRMTSMVFNMYSPSGMALLAGWHEDAGDKFTNTIDRYIESRGRLRVVTTLPFIARTSSQLRSTLWGFQNSQYDDLFVDSENRLRKLVQAYEAESRNREPSATDS
jgi:hypothetical protein